MPALATIDDTIRVSLEFDLDTGLGGSRFFISYTSTTAPSTTDLTSFAADVRSHFSTDFAALMSSAFSLISVTCQDMNSSSGFVGEDTTAVAGTNTHAANPAEVCTVINFKINEHYRGGRPRIFLPLGTNNDLENAQQWNSTFTTAVDTAWGSWLTTLSAFTSSSFDTDQHVAALLYKGYILPPITLPSGFVKNRPKPLTGSVTPEPVLTHKTSAYIGSQRRRTRTPA
jgi:hypothetical protein